MKNQIDYFSLLDLPRSFDIDLDALEKAYITNQQKYHPDTQQGINACEKLKLMQQSVLINEAYQILKDPLKRAAYMLGCLNKQERINDPDLLEEIFDLQEEAGALSSEMDIKSFLEKINIDLQKTFVLLAAMLLEHNMNGAKNLYFRAKYLTEIQKKTTLFDRL
ncbi:MAG: Fe-S protein assembly co-chaperone HscB [Alphaproteobacteria bacterium]|nr:Fe-S protein assembly co-chaperone HscB [Alphaproteobacteria bacterium]